MQTSEDPSRTDPRSRIVKVAARLLRESGPAAVTTRGVAEAAGLQAPAIYRLFGDKDGLLEAVAEHVMTGFVAAKLDRVDAAAVAELDPVAELRDGWDRQIDFGLSNPSVFRLLSDPDRVRNSAAAAQGRQVLRARVHRVAEAGRLRVSEQRAMDLIAAAGIGVTQLLLATPPDQRDDGLAAAMFDTVLAQILTDAPTAVDVGPLSVAVAFRAIAPELAGLSEAERALVVEWSDRAIQGYQG